MRHEGESACSGACYPGSVSVLLVGRGGHAGWGARVPAAHAVRALSMVLDTWPRAVSINASHFQCHLAPLPHSLLVPSGSSALPDAPILNLGNQLSLSIQQVKHSL